ncbi:MAG: branched-chain amino acid ABC transporter substrate-binding protein [Betaproteobacteria bacterium]|nr:branched-chain amino acid ABC transporter substrate-binding protein [Betaproteobacteria bacterium]NBT74507.1 branched-chain amino acid ABC transporter substrate-binding protein [Betaproteobacteria bacterium]NBY13749.1 branched-chain amino acid ABC transporter substrate-binding protein [Betaproteobacteria bacterium]NCA16558.1 branched-chain amino acid ABC transporter substrate-binding protein [Betaproteobacteria bacterium]
MTRSIIALSLCMLFAAQASAQTQTIKIGHVAPMTGNQAHLGKDNEAGAKLAIADLNKAGIKIGGKPVKFELVAEDDAADPKQGTAAAQKLIDAKVVGVVGHLNSGTTIPASALYNKAGIPQVSPSATNPKYTQQGFNTAFRVVANDAKLGGTLGRYAVSELKGKTVAIIDDRSAYGQGVADEFEKSAKAAGAQIAAREYTTDKSTDFMAILTNVKGKKPDVVFFGGMDAVAGPMLRQMKQLGITAKFMGGDGICTSELPKLAGDALGESMVYCAEAGGVIGKYAEKDKAFRARFQKESGEPVKLYAPYVYDATMVLAEAMKKAQSTDPKIYLPELAKIKYDGVTGPISFDKNGDVNGGTLTLYTFKAGKRELVKVIQ